MAVPIAAALTLRTAQFTRGIGIASKGVAKFGSVLGGIAGIAGKTALALTGISAALGAVIIRQTALTSQLVDTASKLGVGVDFLQKFRYAAEQTGVSVNTADMALQRFTRRVAEASNGTGEARAALFEMGIALRDADGRLRSTQDVLFDVADSFQKNTSESDKLRLAFKLFDSEGAALVNTLNNGSDGLKEFFDTAQGLGFVLSQDAAEGVKRFDDALTDLRALLGGVIAQLTSKLAPVLEDVTTKFIAFVQQIAGEQGGFERLAEVIAVKLVGAVETLVVGFAHLYNMIANTINEASKFMEIFSNEKSIATLTEDLEYFREQLGKGLFTRDVIIGSLNHIDELEEALGNVFLGTEENITTAIRIIEAKIAELTAAGEGDGAVNLIDIEALRASFAFAKEEVKKVGEVAQEAVNENLIDEVTVTAKVGWLGSLMWSVFGRERTREFWSQWYDEGYSKIEAVGALFGAGDENSAASKFIKGWDQASAQFQQNLEDMTATGANLFNKMSNGFSDALVKFAETGKLSFKDLFRSLVTELIKIQANKMFLMLFGGAGTGSLLDGALGALGFRADGGPVSANKPYIVGERGPELFMPTSAGTIIPNEQVGMGGGGQPTQVTYNINATDAQSFKNMLARDPEYLFAVTQAGARRLPR